MDMSNVRSSHITQTAEWEELLAVLTNQSIGSVRADFEERTWNEMREIDYNDRPDAVKIYNRILVEELHDALFEKYNNPSEIFEIHSYTDALYPFITIVGNAYAGEDFVEKEIECETDLSDFFCEYMGYNRFAAILDEIKDAELTDEHPNSEVCAELANSHDMNKLINQYVAKVDNLKDFLASIDDEYADERELDDYPSELISAIGAGLIIKRFAEECVDGLTIELKVDNLQLHLMATCNDNAFEVLDFNSLMATS